MPSKPPSPSALATLARCRALRIVRARRRTGALLAFLACRPAMPTSGHGSWRRIHAAFTRAYPTFCLTADPPAALDTMPLAWVREHTVSVHALRVAWHRAQRQGGPSPVVRVWRPDFVENAAFPASVACVGGVEC